MRYAIWIQRQEGLFEIWLCDDVRCDVVTFGVEIQLFTTEEATTICSGVWKVKKIVR